MKKIKIILISILAVVFLGSCEKDQLDKSRITYYPIIKVAGDQLISLKVGESYTDAGATASAGGANLEVKVEGSVNTSVPGVYRISYEAKNADGYSSIQYRWVGVHTQEALDDNLVGKYQRTAGAQGTSTWTKVLPGIYKATDVGGAKLPDQYVYVFNTEKNIIVVPNQPLGGSGSNVKCTNATGGENIDFTPGAVGAIHYKWIVINSGYGTALRQFKKVE